MTESLYDKYDILVVTESLYDKYCHNISEVRSSNLSCLRRATELRSRRHTRLPTCLKYQVAGARS